MSSRKEMNDSILQLLKSGHLNQDMALSILEKLNRNPERKYQQDIAVIGMACRFPGANTPQQFWDNLVQGVNSIGYFPEERLQDLSGFIPELEEMLASSNHQAGYLDQISRFDHPFFHIGYKEAMAMEPYQRLFLETAYHAIEDAGYGGAKLKHSNTGVFVGLETAYQSHYRSLLQNEDISSLVGSLVGLLSNRISYFLDLRGPALVLNTACSSGLVALHQACTALANKECEMALVGGVNMMVIPQVAGKLNDLETSDGRVKAFDKNADGTIWSEGMTALMLKPLGRAREDRDPIYAVIKGSGVNADGASNGLTAPNPEAETQLFIRTWEKAKIDPLSISYVEAHGTGTLLGDSIELQAINDAFRKYTSETHVCGIGSVKTNIGHTVAASGLASLIKVALALKHKKIPATLHYQSPNPFVDPENSAVEIVTELRDWKREDSLLRAGVNSFGFSGTNCHVILEEAPELDRPETELLPPFHLLTISANSLNSLDALIKAYDSYLQAHESIDLEDLCYTVNTGRGQYENRVALVFSSRDELMQQLLQVDLSRQDLAKGKGIYIHVGAEVNRDVSSRTNSSAIGELTEIGIRNFQTRASLERLAEQYVHGMSIPWETLYREQRQKLNLPVYPFDPIKVWPVVDKKANVGLPIESGKEDTNEALSAGDHALYHSIQWVPLAPLSSQAEKKENVLVITDSTDWGNDLADIISSRSMHMVHARLTTAYSRVNASQYGLTVSEADFDQLIRDTSQLALSKIIFAAGNTSVSESAGDSLHALFYLTKALVKNRPNPIEIVLVGKNAQRVLPEDQAVHPNFAALFGLGKVIREEYSGLHCKCIDFDEGTLVSDVVSEALRNAEHYQIALRSGDRYHPQLTPLDLPTVDEGGIRFKDQGVYVITGGTGGIGLELAKNIALQYKVKLILLSRTKLPQRASWDEFSQQDQVGRLLHHLKSLESNGSEVYTYSADVANLDEIAQVIRDIYRIHGKIDGIIHAAGLPGSGMLIEKDGTAFSAGVSAKISGTQNLYMLTLENPPDFLVLFSSIASVVGGIYLGDYVAANSYLDAFSGISSSPTRIMTINWTTWMNTGMAKNAGTNLDVAFRSLTSRRAIKAFEQVIQKNLSNVVVGEINTDNDMFWNNSLPIALAPSIRERIKSPEVEIKVQLTGRTIDAYTDIENQIAHIWGNIFRLPTIDIHDQFYDLGGTSIMGIKIVNRINEECQVTLTVQDVFTYLTIPALAEFVQQKQQEKSGGGTQLRREASIEKSVMPLSHAQRRIWFLQKMNPDLVAYNLPFIRTYDMAIDVALLERAVSYLAARHLLLRTRFTLQDGIPVQVALPEYHPTIQVIDLSEQSDQELLLEKNIYIQKMKPFDLESPPFRIYLYQLGKERFCLYVNFHHILTDGWSIDIFYRELFGIYQSFLHQQPPRLAEAKHDYFDWIMEQKEWENSKEFVEHENYWLRELAKPLPTLHLPTDKKRPSVQTYNGSYHKFEISGELYEKLKKHVENQQITYNNFLLSAYFLLLHKLSQDQDIIVGVPTAGRNQKKWEEVVGIFINTLCIRVQFHEISSFSQLQNTVKQKIWSAIDKAQYPFDLLVEKVNPERDLSRNPIYNVLFQFFDKLHLENDGISQFELSCLAKETDQRIEISFEYNSDLYSESTIRQFAHFFLHILAQVVERPEISIKEITLLTDPEQVELLHHFHGGQVNWQDLLPIHKQFEVQAQKTPNAIALVFEDRQMTYKTLNEKANQLAWLLMNKGVGTNVPVGIFVDRGFQTVVGILAILKAGGAYVPLDPSYPEERISYILANSGAKLLLSENSLMEKVGRIEQDQQIDIINLSTTIERSVVNQTYLVDWEQELSILNPPTESHESDWMYIMYTSGSTGKPKGVLVTHSNVHNFLAWGIEQFQLRTDDVFMLVTSISFDISVFEIFGALLSGGRLCIVSQDSMKDMDRLLAYMEANQVSIWHSVPSLMVQLSTFLTYNKEQYDHLSVFHQLRYLMLGGEAWSSTLAKQVQEIFPRAEIHNMYGPTETTIWISSYKVESGTDSPYGAVLIGKPIANNQIIILDPYDNVCPTGVIGEIYIAGLNVTKGYFRDEEKTRQAFIPQANGQLCYKTGDLGRYLPDGNIEFIGRRDQLVKVRGYRIELGEIELALKDITALQQIAVTTLKDGETSKIVCYYTAEKPLPMGQLKEYARKKLPEYMIPAQFFHVDHFLLTPNGKMDWKSMALYCQNTDVSPALSEVRDEVDKKLVEIWRKLLGSPKIGIHENFFDIGGNSLLIVQLQEMIKAELSQEMSIVDLFQYTTIEKLANHIKENTVNRSSVETGQKRAELRKRLRTMRS
ncbi:non-ribosomal peptide synthetase [Brevibacillus formosus]|uniref:Non-ribosomal peptide synthetase n=1 Tax=Brevibacillus formosus TaxID=54913 RepID=A0A220MFY2_9BACL|nr:non-ribosomal peptide synthetase [Brevibacillus formosus]ASJ53845.1 non-ribosomal peptide synthetase [Brevibacillus formosus]